MRCNVLLLEVEAGFDTRGNSQSAEVSRSLES